MFVLLGLLSFPSRLLNISLKAMLIAAVLILIARPLACFLCLIPFRFQFKPMLFISWVGLKGAVPITLATFPLMMGSPNASLLFDTVFFIVVASAIIQGSSLAVVASALGLKTPKEPEPPVTLEISTLRHVDGDIVDYLVGDNSRASGKMVKELALPDGVVIALITRGDELIPPQGTTRVQSGDHVVLVLKQGTRPLVNQIFGRSEDQRGVIPAAFEFPLRGSITCSELSDYYGIVLDVSPKLTLDQMLKQRMTVKVGNQTRIGPLNLKILSLEEDQSIAMVGMAILSEAEIRAAEQDHTIG